MVPVVLFIPLIGVLAYLVVRGGSMHERSVREAHRLDEEFQAYVRQGAGPHNSTADRLSMLADLRDRGVITTAAFEQEKTRVLA